MARIEFEGVPERHIYKLGMAGPMTGLPNMNYDLFDEVASHVLEHGLPHGIAVNRLEVLNPAENFDRDQSLPRRKYIALTTQQIATCDGIVLLPDWHRSEGAQLEVTIGLDLDLDFYVAFKRYGEWELGLTSREVVENILHAFSDGQDTESVKHPVEPRTIEEKAGQLVRNGARQQTYGHPRGDFDRVAGMWSAILGVPVTAEQVAILMIAFKLARLSQSPQHEDTKVDVIGYTICLDRLTEGLNERGETPLQEWERELLEGQPTPDEELAA